MLEGLLATKIKQKMLAIFFGMPRRSFSLGELRALTSAPLSQLTNNLREFIGDDLLNVAVKNRHRLYRINPRFPLYSELQDLTAGFGSAVTEDEISKRLKRLPRLKLAILSGVFTFQPHLAADLLLVGEDVNRPRLQQMLSEIEKITGQEINFALMDRREYEYRQMMNDRFLRDVLDNPHLVLINHLNK